MGLCPTHCSEGWPGRISFHRIPPPVQTLRRRRMCGRCLMQIACLRIHLLQARLHTRRSPRTRKNASRSTRLSVSSHGIESCMVQRTPFHISNQPWSRCSLTSLCSSGRTICWVTRRTPTAFSRRSRCIRHLFGERPELNPRNCDLAAINVKFCGRIVHYKNIKFHPRQYEALTSMKPPTTVGALMELVHGANWMRTAIPSFLELIELLHSLL